MGLWQNMLDILGVSSKKVSDRTQAFASDLQRGWLAGYETSAVPLNHLLCCETATSMQVCVLVVGLDNSGKSTVVNCLKVS